MSEQTPEAKALFELFQQPRISELERDFLRQIFKGNNELIVALRNMFYGFELDDDEKNLIKTSIKHDAIKKLSPSQIEALDMGRRGLHNEGSELLRERLAGKIEVDFDTCFLKRGVKATSGVWEGAKGLEWTLPSPAPYHSFSTPPKIDDSVLAHGDVSH